MRPTLPLPSRRELLPDRRVQGRDEGKQADHRRQERYRLWYPLLRKELALIGPQARLIAVGRVVDEFLRDQGIVPAASILHYSGQNVSWRQRAVAPYADDFAKYRDAVTMSAILEAAADYAQGTEVPAGSAAEFLAEVTARQEQLSREGRTYPTVSQQQLMFHYKHEFAALQSTGCRGN